MQLHWMILKLNGTETAVDLVSISLSLFYSDVRHILCADHPLSRECLFLGEAGYRNRTIIHYKNCRFVLPSLCRV